jgi:AcrR family transcriptional regulator
VSADTGTRPRRKSEPRDRLLRTATEVFYAKGIHAVGIEEIVDRAQITRSTLYRHFPGKEDLVVAYLEAASQFERDSIASKLTPEQSPDAAVRAVAEAIVGQIENPAFRGCAFLNAAAEYPDVDHPVHQAILDHRTWFADLVRTLFRAVADTCWEESADLFVLLRDGAMTAGCLADPHQVSSVFLDGVERVLAAAATKRD